MLALALCNLGVCFTPVLAAVTACGEGLALVGIVSWGVGQLRRRFVNREFCVDTASHVGSGAL